MEARNQAFGSPVPKLWPNIYQRISIYFTKSWMTLDDIKVHKKQTFFGEGYALDYV